MSFLEEHDSTSACTLLSIGCKRAQMTGSGEDVCSVVKGDENAKSEQQIIDKIALLASSVTLCSPHHSPQEAEVSNKLPLERSKSFFRVLIKCSLTHEYFVFPSTVSFFACAPTYFYLPIVLGLCLLC